MELVSQIQNNLHIIRTILFFYRNRSLLQQLYNSLHFLLKLHKIFSLETSQHNKTYKKKKKAKCILKRKIQSSESSGEICGKMQRPHQDGRHVTGFPGDCSLPVCPACRPSSLMVSEVSRAFWNSCEVVLCSEFTLIVTIGEVNRNSPVFCLGWKMATSRAWR